MKSKNCIVVTLLVALLSSCMGRMAGGGSGAPGGEVIGASATAWNEPAPYGMVLIKRGSLKMGPETQDSLWGAPVPTKESSVESFWMDETEVTVAEYNSLFIGFAILSYVSVSQILPTEATSYLK